MTGFRTETTTTGMIAEVNRVQVGRVDVCGDVGNHVSLTIGDETAVLNAGQALVLAKTLSALFPWEINVTSSSIR